MTIKIALYNIINSKGYNRDFTIIQRVHCDCKGYCTLHKKHRENAEIYFYSLPSFYGKYQMDFCFQGDIGCKKFHMYIN